MQMSWDKRARRYQKFLKSLKRPESSLCTCPAHLHPRPWVPPPCLTSRPQGEESSFWHKRSLSNPVLRMRSASMQARAESEKQQQESLQHLFNEARILKEAFNKVRQGDHISKHSRNVIKKWSEKSPEERPRSKTEPYTSPKDSKGQIAELDKSFAEAVQEEETLKQELKNLRQIAQDRSEYVEENRKLKKKIQQLQCRIKRQDEAQRISRESLHEERELGSREEYVLLSLKKKYDDLLQYVLKVESENQKLKSLAGMSGEADEYFHEYGRENREYDRQTSARLQAELEALRTEMMKKDSYIMECEKRLHAMEALKEENLALYKSLRSTRESDILPDPRDISTALEEEWMRRLSETREMYERAIEGYRDQLQEMQEKFQNVEAKHATHVQQLMQDIEEMQMRVHSAERAAKRIQTPMARESDHDQVQRDSEVRHDPLWKDGEVYHNPMAGSSEVSHGNTHEGRKGDEVTSTSEESRSKFENQEESRDTEQKQELKNSKDYRIEINKKTMTDATTQTSTYQERIKDETNIRNEEVAPSDIHGIDEEMQESKLYLERVNSLVKKLESMKLDGDGAEAILAVIRDTINQCLHEWREIFQLQKSTQKDSADELNRGYVDLQRKLRAKSKQLEAKHKQCKQLEEQNAALNQQCNKLEAKISTVQSSDRLGILKELPDALRTTEQRLSEFQIAFQKSQEEKMALQEQIKLLSDKLRRKETKIASEHEQLMNKEKEVSNLQEIISSLKQQVEEVLREIRIIKEQLSTKDIILEHTSAQLEERIRECASLSSQIERKNMEVNQEARKMQVHITKNESSSQKQLIEAEAKAARYQAQLSALRSEKDHSEKSLRQSIRKLEEHRDQLQLSNSTLQRQLTTITSTYHSMFTPLDLQTLSPPSIGHS